MERKIIQIAYAAYQGHGVMALCDDGTLWYKYRPEDCKSEWCQIDNVPQNEYEQPPEPKEG